MGEEGSQRLARGDTSSELKEMRKGSALSDRSGRSMQGVRGMRGRGGSTLAVPVWYERLDPIHGVDPTAPSQEAGGLPYGCICRGLPQDACTDLELVHAPACPSDAIFPSSFLTPAYGR